MKKLALLVILTLCSGVSVAKEQQIRTNLHSLQFNSAAEKYLEQYTVATVTGSPGKQVLFVRFETYGAPIATANAPLFQFHTSHVDDYVAHIDKYLSWSEQATQNGDAFTKVIGKAKSVAGLSFQFSFHSGNQKKHFLEISLCALWSCAIPDPMVLDKAGAEELKSLLIKLKAGALPGKDPGDSYN